MDTSAYESEQTALEASLKDVDEHGELEQEDHSNQYVDDQELVASMNHFPDWSDLAFAATALALNGPVAPLDLECSSQSGKQRPSWSLIGEPKICSGACAHPRYKNHLHRGALP